MGVGFGNSRDTQVTNTENVVENLSKSEAINNSDKMTETKTKQEMIQDYVTNLVNRTETETETRQNLENNLKMVGNVEQANKMVFDTVQFDEAEEMDFSQINTNAAEITQDLTSVINEMVKTVERQVNDSDLVKEVENAMESGTFNDMYDKATAAAIAKAEQTAKSDASQSTKTEAYVKNRFLQKEAFKAKHNVKGSEKYQQYICDGMNRCAVTRCDICDGDDDNEKTPYHPTCKKSSYCGSVAKESFNLFSDAYDYLSRIIMNRSMLNNNQQENFALAGNDVRESIINQKTHETTKSEELVSNVSKMAVINDDSIMNRINQAYNQTVETIIRTVNEINSKVNAETLNTAIQNNEMSFTNTTFGKSKNLKFSQANDAKNSMAAVAVIEAIINSDTDADIKAISTDMLGLTEKQGTKTETKQAQETDQSTTTETKQGTESSADQTLDEQGIVGSLGDTVVGAVDSVTGAISNVMSGPVIVIIIIVALIVIIVVIVVIRGANKAATTATGAVVQMNKDNPELFMKAVDKIPVKGPKK